MKSLRSVFSFSIFAFAVLLIVLVSAQPNPIVRANQPSALPELQKSPAEVAAQRVPAGQRPLVKFESTVVYDSGGSGPDSVAVRDVNGDGVPDLVVANGGSSGSCGSGGDGAVSVLIGNGDGTFQSPVCYDSGGPNAVSVAIGDLNGDGHADLAVANVCQSGANCNNGGVSVLIGNGDGTFRAAVSYGSGGFFGSSVAIADLNGDSRSDLVVTSACPTGGCTGAGVVSVLMGNGDGSFQAAIPYSPGGFNTVSVAVADVNGDGKPDLVVANKCLNSCPNGFGIGGVSVLLGNGDGSFQAPRSYATASYDAASVAVADVNGDGKPDLVVANFYQNSDQSTGGVSVLLANGDGTFQAAATYTSGAGAAESVAIADVNGDGKPDLTVVNCARASNCSGYGAVSVLVGNGDGTFQAPARFRSGGKTATSAAIADVNGDGRADLLVASLCVERCINQPPGTVGVLLNDLFVTTTAKVAASPNPSKVYQSVTFTATITADPPVPNGEVVSFYNGATKIGTGTTTNGVATLATSFSTAGKFAIKASYPGDAFHKGSSGIVKQLVNP
jgi:hypothetical protein